MLRSHTLIRLFRSIVGVAVCSHLPGFWFAIAQIGDQMLTVVGDEVIGYLLVNQELCLIQDDILGFWLAHFIQVVVHQPFAM